MKKHGFAAKLAALVLCAALMVSALTACTGTVKVKIGDQTVPAGILTYYYGYYYLGMYSSTDTATIAGIAMNQVQQYAAVQKLCKENSIELEALERKDVLDSITSEIAQYGGEDAFDAFLKGCDMTMKQYREMMFTLAKYEKLQSALYDAETGSTPLTDDDVVAYFDENFYHVHLYSVNTSTCESTEEFAAAQELANTLYAALKKGDAAEIGSEYAAKYPTSKSGASVSYTETHIQPSVLDSTVADALKALNAGEMSELLTTTSGYYIVIRESIDEAYARENISTYYSEAATNALNHLVADTISEMGEVKNSDDLDKLDMDAAVEAWYTLYSNMSSTTTAGSILDYLQ